ncbi:MAG: hypothetical protein Q9M19_08400 [Mariprofundaceae bacterium]|nr:hypothetical protein [Mariprofundaceae bacterium]
MSDQRLQALFSNVDELRALVGREVRYLGENYEITDLLADEDMLILSSRQHDDVQEDCFGRAHRIVPKQQHLRFRDNTGQPTAVWEEFAFLDGAL